MKLNIIPLLVLISFPLLSQEKIELNFPRLEFRKTSMELLLESTSLMMITRLNQRDEIKAISPLPKKKIKMLKAKSKFNIEVTSVNGLLQGNYKVWYKNGQLAESLFFNDNHENGIGLFYHPNGQLAAKGIYYMGEMVGVWEFYDEKGQPYNGQWKWTFAANSQNIRMAGEVSDGTPVGTWIFSETSNQHIYRKHSFSDLYPTEEVQEVE